MGAILNAQDVNLHRHIAMKVMLHPEEATDDQMARFIEEAQVTGQLEHPSIVPVYQLGVDGNHQPFYTMKLLKGETFQAVLKGIAAGDTRLLEAWPIARLLTAFVKICEAMRYAHSKGVIHRDLKPSNIMLGEFGEVQVLDWGLAKVLGRNDADAEPGRTIVQSVRTGESSDMFQSMDGSVAGTPHYMAPEQAAGRIHKLDERTDVYALGAILYQLLALRPPVDGKSVHKVLSLVQAGKIEALDSVAGEVPHFPGGKIPSPLSAIAMKALSRRPEDRFQDVGALLRDIQHYQNGFATEAEDAGAFRQLALFLKRNKTFAIAASLVTLAVLIGSAVSLVQRQRAVGALADLEAEQRSRTEDRVRAAPAQLQVARRLLRDGELDLAASTLATAEDYDPQLEGLAEAKLVHALSVSNFADAVSPLSP